MVLLFLYIYSHLLINSHKTGLGIHTDEQHWGSKRLMTDLQAIKKKFKDNWLVILLYTIMICLYISDVLYMWQNGINLQNSDSTAELILAKKLNQEG